MSQTDTTSDSSQQSTKSYKDLFKGKFYGVLRWHQLDSIWNILTLMQTRGWYVYEVNKQVPENTLIAEELQSKIASLDAYIREHHEEEYCGIVYANELDTPDFIKVFDPKNLGTSCSIAKTPPLPKWIISLAKPEDLSVNDDEPNKPKRWLGNLFAKYPKFKIIERNGGSLDKKAILILEDGSEFHGKSIGYSGTNVGEVVFNTALTGYQEILTDPSYASQMVTLTYPHIGNVGINKEDEESDTIFATGSNKRKEVVAIADIDTRRLTRILREKGAQRGCIVADISGDISQEQIDSAKDKIASFPGLKGADLAKVVSTKKSYEWNEGTWDLDPNINKVLAKEDAEYNVVAYDFGVKKNILRMLVDRGCHVTVVPAQTPAEDVLAMNPDGVFLSNGPGDPEPCDYAIEAITTILDKQLPTFGICLGHQLLGLSSGATTVKMKFGHHGANHPVQDLDNKKVMITSQNHGFAVDEDTLPSTLTPTHRSLFDGSLQGIKRTDCPAYSFQGHPEASPGPHDIAPIFDDFIALMKEAK
ncbi:Carbamoyl-phosphate synthase small chain [Nymphon striatum]|nr:Carbamoyl-phosphate synthase small chain [Nymphon striatum]